MNQWWGYLHTSGTLQVKRFFSMADFEDAMDSPFVKEYYGPWECAGREEAIAKLKEEIGGKNKCQQT